MAFSIRTRLSFGQLVALLTEEQRSLLLMKHGVGYVPADGWLADKLSQIPEGEFASLLEETLRTAGTLRAGYPGSKWLFDERLKDFEICAALDGYEVTPGVWTGSKSYKLISQTPTLPGTVAVEDDLTSAVNASQLPEASAVLSMFEKSATAFSQQPPDYNACLGNARTALETLGLAIANARGGTPSGWGQALTCLRTSGLITQEEEAGIAGVYRFVSYGAHKHVALSEQEMTRLGRSMVLTICYFLVKEHNA